MQVTLTPGSTSWVSARMSWNGHIGSISSGKVARTRRPSVCSTSTGWPATPSIGCSTTKPVRLVVKSVTARAVASKLSVPSAAPLIFAR